MDEDESELESIILDFDPFGDSLEEGNESEDGDKSEDGNHLLTTFIDDYETPYGLNPKYR